MIKIKIYKDENDSILEYETMGHAKDARVCSAVSVITQAPILTLLENFKLDGGKFGYAIEDAYLFVKLPFNNKITNVLMDNMLLTLKELERLYPDEIKLIEVKIETCDVQIASKK